MYVRRILRDPEWWFATLLIMIGFIQNYAGYVSTESRSVHIVIVVVTIVEILIEIVATIRALRRIRKHP